jgi:hypothetical protein
MSYAVGGETSLPAAYQHPGTCGDLERHAPRSWLRAMGFDLFRAGERETLAGKPRAGCALLRDANGGLASHARPPNGCYPPMSHFFWTPCHLPPARSQSALLVKRWVGEPVDGDVVFGELVSGVVGEPLGGAGGMPGVFGMLPPGGEPGRLDGAGLGFVGPGVVLVCADASAGANPRATTRPVKTSFFIFRPSYAARASKAIANPQVVEIASAVDRRIRDRGRERPRSLHTVKKRPRGNHVARVAQPVLYIADMHERFRKSPRESEVEAPRDSSPTAKELPQR